MKFFEEAKVFKKHMTIISSISLGICLFDLSLLICQSMLISLTDRMIKCGDRWTNWENISTILNILVGKKKKKKKRKERVQLNITSRLWWHAHYHGKVASKFGRSVYLRSLSLCLASLMILLWIEGHLSKLIFPLKFQSNVLKHCFPYVVVRLGISTSHDCLFIASESCCWRT